MGTLITVALLLAFIIFCVFMAVKSSKSIKAKRLIHLRKMGELNAKEHGLLKHVVGLPLPENVICDVYYREDKITIEGGGSIFNLSFSKINDMVLTTDVEIQKAYVSSAGGAVAGGMIFGPLGAIVGGRSKQKETKTTTKFLVITYAKDDGLEYISFDVTNDFRVGKMVKLFKQLPQNHRSEIDL
ncbi:hypothetical protein MKZ26_03210 [Sporosarcina sp. FSL K6-6792]|uniref:hypothetical protein n=1 Tax=Sporosarcina sp. FSL K6-6792 TaxID=2921559 RepID=UPI0030F6C889